MSPEYEAKVVLLKRWMAAHPDARILVIHFVWHCGSPDQRECLACFPQPTKPRSVR